LFPLFYFVLIFLCILFLLGFPVFALVFPCIASLCLFRVFFSFYSSADLLRACFATLRPLSEPFSAPPPHRASNASFSVRDLLARDRCLFPCIFIVSLLVISHVSIGLLLGVMLGPDLWVMDVSIILAFGSRRTSVGLEVLSPQCQGISVGLGFSALSVKE
jgi:hypothetical protein